MGWKEKVCEVSRSLPCAHCGSTFSGSWSQGRRHYYEKTSVYCSRICRKAALQEKLGIERGPCPTCGQKFRSNYHKIFCSMDCYVKSDRMKEVQREAQAKSKTPEAREKIAASLRNGEIVPCQECGGEVYSTPSNKKKFCSKSCYRAFFAKRFDRWVANPRAIDLAQCYDEFLDQNVLECPVDGCTWKGSFLSSHMNQHHGVPAEEFKRAAGFNLSTGVISKKLRLMFESRDPVGIALFPIADQGGGKPSGYISKEGREHRQKARALASARSGPLRICEGCGERFQQSQPFGRTKFCTIECRDKTYAARRKARAKRRVRDDKGRFIWVPPRQEKA